MWIYTKQIFKIIKHIKYEGIMIEKLKILIQEYNEIALDLKEKCNFYSEGEDYCLGKAKAYEDIVEELSEIIKKEI